MYRRGLTYIYNLKKECKVCQLWGFRFGLFDLARTDAKLTICEAHAAGGSGVRLTFDDTHDGDFGGSSLQTPRSGSGLKLTIIRTF